MPIKKLLRKRKRKQRDFRGLHKYLNELLMAELKHLIAIKQRKRRRRRRAVKRDAKADAKPSSVPQIIVSDRSNPRLIEEQQGKKKEEKKEEKKGKPKPEILAITAPPVRLALPAATQTPPPIPPRSTPKKSAERRDTEEELKSFREGWQLTNNRTGAKQNLTTPEFRAIEKNANDAPVLREKLKAVEEKLTDAQFKVAQEKMNDTVVYELGQHAKREGMISKKVSNKKSTLIAAMNKMDDFRQYFYKHPKTGELAANTNSAAFKTLKNIISRAAQKRQDEAEQEALDMQEEQEQASSWDSDTHSAAGAAAFLANGPPPASSPPLSNLQIDEMMGKKKGYLGTFAVDTMKAIHPDADSYEFITNTSPLAGSSGKVGHWVAIKVDPATLEYYDPLGMPPNKTMMKALVAMVKGGKEAAPRQFKVNRMRDQAATSQTCGWHSMRFLVERTEGKPFKEATGFNRLGEKQVAKFQKRYKEFGYF